MRDFFYVNILNEGIIPWIFEKGPIFGRYTAAGIYELLARDPRVKIEITTRELAERRREEYLKEKKEKENSVKEPEVVKEEKKEEIVEETIEIIKNVEPDEDDLLIDDILSDDEGEMISIDVDLSDTPPVLDADGMVIYSDEELSKMTKKQLKAILESRGHFGFTGKHFEKGDPLGAMYHDSVETLREKVRKTQETF